MWKRQTNPFAAAQRAGRAFPFPVPAIYHVRVACRQPPQKRQYFSRDRGGVGCAGFAQARSRGRLWGTAGSVGDGMGLFGHFTAFSRGVRLGAALPCALALAACSGSAGKFGNLEPPHGAAPSWAPALPASSGSASKFGNIDPRYGVAASPRVVEPGQPVPKGGGVYRVGQPYMVGGRMYFPQADPHYRAEGLASWYGSDFHGRLTANGEVYDMHALSVAHPTLPMPSYARVTNLANRRSVIVRINDRGPYHANREIDLSGRAAEVLGFRDHGVARVRVEYVGAAPREGSDDRILLATLREGAPAPAPSVMTTKRY